MKQMVAYGIAGSRNERSERKTAQAWAAEHAIGVLLWRRDGQSTSTDQIERRTRLHQALFCVRAGFAQGLWLPSWTVLGNPAAQDLVCAEVRAAKGSIIVNGVAVQPAADSILQMQAQAWVRLADRLDPRQIDHEDGTEPDIGEWDSPAQRARLARKLRDDFELTRDEVADFMNRTRYLTQTGKDWSGANVKHLLDHHRADPPRRAAQILAEQGESALTAPVLATFGPDAVQLVGEAKLYNQGLSRPFNFVIPIIGKDGQPNPAHQQLSDLADSSPIYQLLLGGGGRVVGSVYASSEYTFGATAAARELVYANCWRDGVVVVIAGEPVDQGASVDQETAILRAAAQSAVRLRAMLRAHDEDSVADERHSLQAARRVAQNLASQNANASGAKWLLREIATHLNREGFVTRKRTGEWHASSVRKLLQP